MKKCLLPIIFGIIIFSTPGQTDYISVATVKTWAHKLGFELSQLGKYVTNIEKFEQSYKQAEIKPRDGNALVHEIAKDIKAMTDAKMSAIKRIMDVAETTAESASDDDSAADFNYTNAKNNTIDLQYSVHFGGEINLNLSAVHVPTNVYDRAPDVIKAIKWSQTLDETFINNLQNDPSLSWQYFGSSTGFMRQYPATVWNPKPVDLFDCRTRGWYIEAATSPKDVLILVDTSGSMMGMKKEIARHVVNNILDTLGNNDFVNIITFSNETHQVVSCFNDTLVQANLANVRELKDAIENMQTERIANFSLVLTYAFELLEQFRLEKDGAMCNQAIMLVTDGVPYNYKEIFQLYNWRNSPYEPDKADMPVRVFTYLIGREVTDVREVKWMACANRGYYVHLSTFAEVREQVLNYVPVMARPLVLGKTFHPPIWTPVYADITDPKMTDWLWERRECKEQKQRFLEYHKDKKLFFSSLDQRDRYLVNKPNKKHHDFNDDVQAYQLMTSVSMPVYDRRENATRIADLLGVAGTDVPIQQIQKLMLPHMLGVNGYAFIVTNNGYILIHPDLRPVFQGILKPSYNAVDMAEVELMDNNRESRDFDEGITMFRNEVINQANGSVILYTKYHYDDMKRVGRMKRRYDYTAIEQTPFTLVVSLPEYDHGSYRVHATEEIHRAHVNGKNATDYFSGKTWRVHPDWTYCKYHYEDDHKFESPEKLLVHFLERTRQPGWFWSDKKLPSQPPEYSVTNPGNSGSHTNSHTADRESFYCDRLLLQSLVYDAKVTAWFANINTTRDEKGPLARLMKLLPRKEFQQRFKLTLAFMASHSGLMRWQDYPIDDNDDITIDPDEHFSQMYRRGIDEIWYKRAVEQFYIHPDSFVFSIPIDEDNGADNTTLVTASRAIFIKNNKAKAPAAVVGFQFKHKALQELFRDITYNCDKIQNCHQSCSNTSLECYLIDNNGYIIAAENESDAGKFFGNIRGGVMSSLIQDGIYDKIKIFDYQAVCFTNTQTSSHGSLLSTPWKTTQHILTWIFGQILLIWTKIGFINSNNAYAYENDGNVVNDEDDDDDNDADNNGGGDDNDGGGGEREGHDDYIDGDGKMTSDGIIKGESSFDPRVLINKTKPQPCDKEVYLYLLKNESTKYDIDFNSSKGCERPYVVQPVDFSNMLLVVVDVNCPNTDKPPIDTEPVEIYYNSTLACQKAFNGLKRKRPQYCVRTHKNESEIKDRCGDASIIGPNTILITLLLILKFVN